MDSQEIPAEVRQFLRENIASYEQLEVLLFLWGHSDHAWTPEVVASNLNVPKLAAAEALDHLCRRNLLDVRLGAASLSFRYCPGNSKLADAVERLVRVYEINRLGVVNLMNVNAIERVRTEAMRLFADAFILGRKKDKDG